MKNQFKKYLIIAACFFSAVLILAVGYFIYVYIQIKKGELIEYQGKVYTKEELKKAFPPKYYEAPAKNTPEDVYATFRQALLDENLELALEQIADPKNENIREKYRKILSVDGKMKEWGNKLPQTITKEEEYGNFAYYNIVNFSKDINGYWKIEFLWYLE